MPAKPRKPRKKTIYQRMIDRFLSHKVGNVPRNFWGAETKAAKALLTLVPEEDFWLKCTPPGEKINSLNWFLSEWGRRYIKEQQKAVSFEASQKELFDKLKEKADSENKSKPIAVEDYGIKHKPTNILDFINGC